MARERGQLRSRRPKRFRGRQFSAGSVLGRGFSIWFKNLLPFGFITLLVYSPIVLYTAVIISERTVARSAGTWGTIMQLGAPLLQFVAAGALIFGVFEQLRGKRAGIGACIAKGLSRLGPVLGVGIVTTILIALPMFVGGFLGVMVGMLGPLLVLVFVVPTMVIACTLYVAVPAAVVERPGIGGALSRSSVLTKGSKWRIFGVLFVVGLLTQVADLISQAVFLRGPVDVESYMWFTIGLSILLGALGAVMQGVAYHDLRVAKEGVGIEELAKVFD